jgi:hypothetical protein
MRDPSTEINAAGVFDGPPGDCGAKRRLVWLAEFAAT